MMTIATNPLTTFAHGAAVAAAFAGVLAIASTFSDSTEGFDGYSFDTPVELSGESTRARGTRPIVAYVPLATVQPQIVKTGRGTRPTIEPPTAQRQQRGPHLRGQS